MQSARADAALAAFYRARNYRPVWVDHEALRPEAYQLMNLLGRASDDGLRTDRYATDTRRALGAVTNGDRASLARAELALSRAYADYVRDLRKPRLQASLAFIDDGFAASVLDRRAILEEAATAPSLQRQLADLHQLNPLYSQLRGTLAAYRARWSGLPPIPVPSGPDMALGDQGPRVQALRRRLGLSASPTGFDDGLQIAVRQFQSAHGLPATGRADERTIGALNLGPAHYERLILANLERARALPPLAPGRRFILVDAASARLWLYDATGPVGSMRVVVGMPSQPTPMMAGLIRYAMVNPYWNVPPDIVRAAIAPRVVSQGAAYLQAQNYEALSDWSPAARILSPEEVDWPAVAAGRIELRVRQRPGPDNMMGGVKFMLPNQLGIYLHDTPIRTAFAAEPRTFSHGCVRLEDAAKMAQWLLGAGVLKSASSPTERRIDIAAPVPVYITYLTVWPADAGLQFNPDVYKRDPLLLAELDASVVSTAAGTGAKPRRLRTAA